MNYLYAATSIIGIIFMIVFIFIGVWLFIIAIKAFKQLKYKNYILEKIYTKLNDLSSNSSMRESIDNSVDLSELDIEDDFSKTYNNVKTFEKSDNK